RAGCSNKAWSRRATRRRASATTSHRSARNGPPSSSRPTCPCRIRAEHAPAHRFSRPSAYTHRGIMPVVSSHLADRICVIVIDNPPVNATSQAVRQALREAVDAADGDAGVGAIVIACAGNTFIAGADIKEFGLPPADPHL